MSINPETPLDDLHPARFLKVHDLLERWRVNQISVTIHSFQIEDTIPNPHNIDPETKKPAIVAQPVLYFVTRSGEVFPRGYLLATKADIANLKAATGETTVGKVIGKRISIIVSEFKHKAVLRISPTAPTPEKKQP